MSCAFCEAKPQYLDRCSWQYVCLEHARLEVVARQQRVPTVKLDIRPATQSDYDRIEELALYFWDETDVDCFDRQYDVLACPAHLACEGTGVMGLASYAVEGDWDAMVLVMLNVLPDFQGRGAGHDLLDAVRDTALAHGLNRIIVVTSNDDLPALALYQGYGFCISGVMPGLIADDHGGEFPGFAGIPVRDEIRLVYQIGTA
jgi:GNAT superfamily N-acetyltransferase